ncbi:MAG TPA: hypothetical protein VMK42_09360 [Anaeromyxobacteraceae bacterium]|nr:hypothetical protein [Anaeromyxobacteraceae bacterium]
MSPARARLEGLSQDLKAFEVQIRNDMKEIRTSLTRIKWALRMAGGLSLIAIVLFVATVVGPLSHQLKQIALKIEQLENQEVVAALTDVAKLRAAIQSETKRIELEAHSDISETLERSHRLNTELQADLAKVLPPNNEPFPEVYSSASGLAAAIGRASEKVGPEGQFPPLLQKAANLNGRLDAALANVEGPSPRGRARDFPAVYDRATALQAKLETAQKRITGAGEGQQEPPFPEVYATALAVDARLAAAYRKTTGAERGKPEPEFPDLYKQAVSTQKKAKKTTASPTSSPAR